MEKYKTLLYNAGLAAVAAFAGAFAESSDWLPESWLKYPVAAAAYGALRIAAGVIAAGLQHPISVDKPPAGGPDPTA